MEKIQVEKNVSQEKLDELGVVSWPIWEKEISEFPWSYNEKEICYILEGSASVVSNDGSESVKFGEGDLVTFLEGLDCTWKIVEPVKKHYKFGQ